MFTTIIKDVCGLLHPLNMDTTVRKFDINNRYMYQQQEYYTVGSLRFNDILIAVYI